MTRNANSGIITGITLSALGLLAMTLPPVPGADMMAWGFGTIALGLFVLIMGAVTLALFLRRRMVLKRMEDGSWVLASWTYDAKDWTRMRNDELKSNRGMPVFGGVLGGVFVLIGLGFLIADPDEMLLMFAIMAGVGVVIALSAWLATALRNRAVRRDPGEVVIARGGVWFMGHLTDWNKVTSWMDRAEVKQKGKKSILLIEYRVLAGRAGRIQKSVLEIPVPEGREEEAKAAARKLNDQPY